MCERAHLLRLEVVTEGSRFRQAGGRGSVVGKDPPSGCIGRRSDVGTALACGQTPTAEFAISALVRPINIMSTRIPRRG